MHRLAVDADGRLAEAGPAVRLPPGSGPRHLVVVEDHLVVACELSGQLWVGRADGHGGWSPVVTAPCSGVADAPTVQPSALRADGDLLFVANRGPDTVAAFVLDRGAATLTRTAEFGCGGAEPRDLVLEPGRLWVANQGGDVLSVFDRRSLPPAAPPVQVPSLTPTCVLLRPPAGR